MLEAPRREVLHADVDRHLDARVEVVVLDRLDRVVGARLARAPLVVPPVQLAPAGAAQLVEGEMERVEEHIIQKDPQRHLRRNSAKGRVIKCRLDPEE